MCDSCCIFMSLLFPLIFYCDISVRTGVYLSLSCSFRCLHCQGHGYKTCSVCHGSKNLLHYILLTVTWCVAETHTHSLSKSAQTSSSSVCDFFGLFMFHVFRKNNVEDFIPDRQPDFPDKKFEKVTGDPFFIDENVLVKTRLLFFFTLNSNSHQERDISDT